MIQLLTNDIVNDGLVLYLDAGIKGSYPGSGTTWTDLAGIDNATLINGPTFVTGDGSGTFDFDGTNDYAQASNAFDPSSGMTAFVVVKREGGGTGNFPDVVLNKWWDGSTRSFDIQVGASNYLVTFRPSGASVDSTLSVADATLTGNWAALAFTVNATTVKAYKNGVETGSASSGGQARKNNAVLRVSSYVHTSLNGFGNNRVSIVMLYNRALTAGEVAQNFEATRHRFGI